MTSNMRCKAAQPKQRVSTVSTLRVLLTTQSASWTAGTGICGRWVGAVVSRGQTLTTALCRASGHSYRTLRIDMARGSVCGGLVQDVRYCAVGVAWWSAFGFPAQYKGFNSNSTSAR